MALAQARKNQLFWQRATNGFIREPEMKSAADSRREGHLEKGDQTEQEVVDALDSGSGT